MANWLRGDLKKENAILKIREYFRMNGSINTLKILGLGSVIHVFGSFFVKNAKKDTRTLFERPKSDKF